MLFKFLTGKEIGNLQTGLILSQVGGLLMVLFIFAVLNLPDDDDTPKAIASVFLAIGIIRILLPILVGKGLKIAFWVVIALSILKLVETFVAVSDVGLKFIWYLLITGSVEVVLLIHLLSPKARAELNNSPNG